MSIALDATASAGAQPTGVGRYARELLWTLAASHPSERFLFCYRSQRWRSAWQEQVPRNARRRPMLEQWVPRCSLFHGLAQRLPQARLKRAVCTFHDLFVLTGDYSTPEFRARFAAQARHAVSRADLLIAISSFTATQLTALLGVESARVRIIPHGVAVPPELPVGPREPIILSVGALQTRKNIVRLVEAFEQLPAEWTLVLAGSPGYGAAEIQQRIAGSSRRQSIHLRGYVSPQELEQLYRRASVFAFPSLDEGFGLPVLEAMAWGLPVLTSNRSALPEVAGDAAILVDPFSTEEIAAGLRRLIGNEVLRKDLTRRGRDRAAAYSWQAAAEATWRVYRELRNC